MTAVTAARGRWRTIVAIAALIPLMVRCKHGPNDPKPAVPEAPTGLIASMVARRDAAGQQSASTYRIDLSWTDNAQHELGYSVERCAGVGCSTFTEIVRLGANATSYPSDGLLAATMYRYRVRAFNEAGSSDFSNIAGAETDAAPGAVVAPSGLTASAASVEQINLSWTDNASDEDGFRIQRCSGVGCAAFAEIGTASANETSYRSQGLTAATSYSYRVRAYNATGSSGYSNTASATTREPIPNAASGVTATARSSTQIDLAWTDNSSNETAFGIQRCAGEDCIDFADIVNVAANQTTYQNTGLSPATAYRFRVIAINGSGWSASNVGSATTQPAPAPPDLVVLSLTHTPANPTAADAITFTAVVKNTGGSAAGASTLELRIGGETAGASQTRLAVPALAAGQSSSHTRQATLPAGSYINTATADVTGAVTESNETNNVTTESYSVAPAQRADLVVSAPTALTVTPTTVKAGGSVALPPWTVKNQGTAASNGFRNGFYLSTDAIITSRDTRLTGNSNLALAPGASFNWGGPALVIPANTAPGAYYIGILVDDLDGTVEVLETNNYKSAPLTVVAPVLVYSFEGNVNNSGALSGYNGSATSVTYPAGKFGTAIKFDGSAATAAVLTGTHAVFGSGAKWTISLWYREVTLQTGADLWSFRGNTAGWETYHGVSATVLNTCSDGGCGNVSPPPAAGAWHNLMYRYDAASSTAGAPVEIYVDGLLRATIANATGILLVDAGVADIRLGDRSNFYIDELRVYNAVFTLPQQCTLIIGGTWTGASCTLP